MSDLRDWLGVSIGIAFVLIGLLICVLTFPQKRVTPRTLERQVKSTRPVWIQAEDSFWNTKTNLQRTVNPERLPMTEGYDPLHGKKESQ